METNQFINELKNLGWNIQNNNDQKNIKFDLLAEGRFAKAPSELKEFISQFSVCANAGDNVWFSTIADYLGDPDCAFAWNEFEKQSLEDADTDDIDEIQEFWNSNLPFLMAVKNGYGFAAVVLKGETKGHIVLGNEPEYEDTVVVAESINDFFDLYISILKNETQHPAFSFIK